MADPDLAPPRPDARRLAEEAFAAAASAGSLPRVREELFALVDLLRRQPQVRKTLADISIPAEAKQGLLRDLIADRVDPHTLSLLDSLVGEDSLSWRLGPVLDDLAQQAVLAEAEADGTLDTVGDELFRFARLLEAEPRLRGAITDPVLPDENKVALVDDLLASRASEPTAVLVRDAVRKPGDPVERIQGLADRAAARRNRVVVEARTAVPLDDDRRARLSSALSAVTGRNVDLETVIDPEVVGGVMARVGDEVIDGTVRRKLELALEQLTV
jgi:F-type H+-transporting ATPase subunit delta